MSTQKSQSHKRQEQNNTKLLDELINKIENKKTKYQILINQSSITFVIKAAFRFLRWLF